MRSTSSEAIKTYILNLCKNINEREIPSKMNGKRVVPAQKKKIQEIKQAQIEPLLDVVKYIDNIIHGTR